MQIESYREGENKRERERHGPHKPLWSTLDAWNQPTLGKWLTKTPSWAASYRQKSDLSLRHFLKAGLALLRHTGYGVCKDKWCQTRVGHSCLVFDTTVNKLCNVVAVSCQAFTITRIFTTIQPTSPEVTHHQPSTTDDSEMWTLGHFDRSSPWHSTMDQWRHLRQIET